MADTLCALPWMQVSNSTDGRLQVCCKGEEDNWIVDDQGRPFRIFELEDYEAFWNSSYLKKLRQQMMRGERPEVCRACFEVEDAGAESHRQAKNIQFRELFDRQLSQTSADGQAPVKPALLDLRISNVCNLKCRMCTPYSSNQWVDDWNALFDDVLKRDGTESKLRKLNWYEGQRFWKTIERYGEDLEHLFFAGGEPTLIAQQHDLLRGLVEAGFATKISLSYNTNVTYLPDSLLELWKEFKAVHLYCSVDGYGPVNSYIRFPSQWETVHRGLQKIDQLLPELKSGQATIATTVQAYNITRLNELFNYMLESFDNILRFPFLETLVTPSYLDVRILPRELKELATERLVSYRDKYQSVWETKDLWFVDDSYSSENEYHKYLMTNWSHKIDHIIQFMNGRDLGEHLPAFLERTAYFDRTRNQSLREILPEFDILN